MVHRYMKRYSYHFFQDFFEISHGLTWFGWMSHITVEVVVEFGGCQEKVKDRRSKNSISDEHKIFIKIETETRN